MKKIFLLLSLAIFLGHAAYAQKPATAAVGPKTVKKVAKPKLVLDFISKGAGIDLESFAKVEAFIKEHPKKPAYDVKAKGREGEKKISLMLTELDAAEQTAFATEIKKLIAKPDMVLITDNTPKVKLMPGATIKGNVVPSTKCRLVLSFISKGAGIDREANEKIKEYIAKHPKKPAFEEHKWGREGEVDYCLQLKELSPKAQNAFVSEINALITKKDMVLVTENQDYVKKGR